MLILFGYSGWLMMDKVAFSRHHNPWVVGSSPTAAKPYRGISCTRKRILLRIHVKKDS